MSNQRNVQRDSQEAMELAAKIVDNLEGIDAEIAAKALVVALAYAIDRHWRQDAKKSIAHQCYELLNDIVFDGTIEWDEK